MLLYVGKRHEFLSALLLEGILDEGPLSLSIDPSECVTAKAIEVPAIWMSRVGKEHGTGMVRFRDIGQKVERSIIINEESLRVSTLASNDVRSLHRISGKEDRPVQANDVVIAISCVHLHREPTRISSKIRELSAKSNSGESQEKWRLLANLGQEAGLANARDIFGRFEVAEMTRPCWVDSTL